MKAVILAGGLGTRLSEETGTKPKPMVEIGEKPMLLHIVDIYAKANIKDLIICTGYKNEIIEGYFSANPQNDLNITLVDTGKDTMTGGRIKRIADYVKEESFFHLTYGDGLADIDIHALTTFHNSHGLDATVTAVKPPARFGVLTIEDNNLVTAFQEKPAGDIGYINGGFFVLSPNVMDLIEGDDTIWEGSPMERLAAKGQLAAYKHNGFWQCMDTLKDKQELQTLWDTGKAPWVH